MSQRDDVLGALSGAELVRFALRAAEHLPDDELERAALWIGQRHSPRRIGAAQIGVSGTSLLLKELSPVAARAAHLLRAALKVSEEIIPPSDETRRHGMQKELREWAEDKRREWGE